MFQRIYIEITNVCNLNCAFCLKNTRSSRNITLEEFTYILNEICNHTEHVYFHVQGEPLLHPDFILFMDECYQKGLKVHIVTNGTLLKNYNNIFFKHPALASLSISMHASQIKIDDDNYFVIKQLIETTEFNNVSVFLRLWTQNNHLTKELLKSLISPFNSSFDGKRVRIKKNLFIDMDEEFEWPNLNQSFQSFEGKCYSGIKMMSILSNGDVTPCCLDANGILKVGNIFTTEFNQIVKSDRCINIIEGFKKRHCVETLCQGCTYRLRFNN